MHVTSGFFLLRFLVSIGVAIVYILVAAGIQYAFVGLMGESTFNYIVGGLLSLLLGVIVCNFGGAVVFMFVRGWHVAALAYAKKIYKSGASSITVGMKVFAKNIVGFGAVYGVRTIVRNVVSSFTDTLWDLLEDVPFVSNLKSISENPVVEHMAKAVLDYGFDATIFYLIKHKPEDMSEVPNTVIEGLKRYLCCLPSIMVTAVGTYVVFEVLPAIVKVLVIFGVFMTQGICAGILITVLVWPLFYILENTFFKPLTMMMFMTCFAAVCDKEVDSDSKVAQMVDSIINGEDGQEDVKEASDTDEQPAVEMEKPRRRRKQESVEADAPAEPLGSAGAENIDVEPDLSDLGAPSTGSAQGFGDLGPVEFGGDDSDFQPEESAASAMDAMLNSLGQMPTPEPRIREEEEEQSGILGLKDTLKGIDPSIFGGFDFSGGDD